MPNQIELDSDFDAPALRAGVDVLLILARALRIAFSDPDIIDSLEHTEVSCTRVAQILGSLVADPRFSLSNRDEISNIWQAFFLHNDIRTLPDDQRAILERIRDESLTLTKMGTDCLEDLHEANVQAHKLVRDILAKHRLQRLIPSSPVPIELKNDPTGAGYCCATSRLTGKIVWSYQQVSHALIGLILADLIFCHEYLSHLAPQNPYLGHAIREQWLVAALVGSLRENRSYPRWKVRLWPAYQRMLQDYIAQSRSTALVRMFGYEGTEEASMLLYSSDPNLFWKLTVEILKHKSDPDHATLAAWIAFRLIGQDPKTLGRHKINSLKELQPYL
jgi:hypothetical protein